MYFSDVVVATDTSVVHFEDDQVEFKNDAFLFISPPSDNTLEIRLVPRPFYSLDSIVPPKVISIEDSLRQVDDYQRILFDLPNGFRGQLSFLIYTKERSGRARTTQLNLMLSKKPEIYLDGKEVRLFLEEQKTIELPVEDIDRLNLTKGWTRGRNVDYRLRKSSNTLFVDMQAHTIGSQQLEIVLETKLPYLNDSLLPSFLLDPIHLDVKVLSNRLDYIHLEPGEFYHDQGKVQVHEVIMSYSPRMQENTTYRLEERKLPGGRLIAELFMSNTVQQAAERKMLGELRIYDVHIPDRGYLYIKEGDEVRFLTNITILPQPKIESVDLLRTGADWNANLTVKPGEALEIRVQGSGLQKSKILFDGLPNAKLDSLRSGDEALFFTTEIPVDIEKSKVTLFLNQKVTQYQLRVSEYQRPSPLDFVTINFDGDHNYFLTAPTFNKPVLYDDVVKDINIIFKPERIDQKDKLYGVQYLDMEIRLLDANNTLLDIKEINDIKICPNENSPRFGFYKEENCRLLPININDYLRVKTYNLQDFGQIILTVKHRSERYGEPGFERVVRIILQRKYQFDVNVSFPAGLLTRTFDAAGDSLGFGNISGISTAILAQLGFYSDKRLGQLRPYTVGAGFIALNAFNFNANAENRDIGAVALVTINPINSRAKFSVPIYVGGGYFLNQDAWFVAFGPGLRFNL